MLHLQVFLADFIHIKITKFLLFQFTVRWVIIIESKLYIGLELGLDSDI